MIVHQKMFVITELFARFKKLFKNPKIYIIYFQQDMLNDFHCICPDGYTGKRCSININDCLNEPCMHGGQCIDKVGYYHCICPPGYSGKHCEVNNKIFNSQTNLFISYELLLPENCSFYASLLPSELNFLIFYKLLNFTSLVTVSKYLYLTGYSN